MKFSLFKDNSTSRRSLSMVKGLTKVSSSSKESSEVQKGAQRELYQYERPTQELGMSELIKSHEDGTRFLYAAVTDKEVDNESSLLRKLIQWQPKMMRKEIPISNLPKLNLYDEVEIFKFSNILPKSKEGMPKTYIHIAEVMIIYGSLISTDSAFSKVKVCIMDDRLLKNKVAKSYIANTNITNKATMSLSYCFPRDEVDALSLTLSRDTCFLEEGRQWGVAQVRLTLEETDFPIQTSNVAVRAINAIPQSMLEEYRTNPDAIDISIVNNDISKLRNLYINGDLADETTPVKDRHESVKYAKSSLVRNQGDIIVNHVSQGWDFLKDARSKGINPVDNSIEPEDDGEFRRDYVEESLNPEEMMVETSRFLNQQPRDRKMKQKEVVIDESLNEIDEYEEHVKLEEIKDQLKMCDMSKEEGNTLKSAMKPRRVEIVTPSELNL